jgi:uncharacterized protein (UPF0332 family)
MNYDKKIEWCLTKANKGLKKIPPNVGTAMKHISTAKENLQACDYLEKGKYTRWCAPTIFYAVYHCFLALLIKEGFETENQDCTFALVATLIEKGSFPLEIEKLEKIMSYDVEEGLRGFRERFQYGIEGAIDKDLLTEMKNLAQEILTITENESTVW